VQLCWDDNGATNLVDATAYYIPDYKGQSPVLPIDPMCGSTTVTLAYNAGSLVPSFETLKELTIKLQFVGNNSNLNLPDILLSSGVFVSTNPQTTALFTKGITPKPYKIYFDPDTSILKIQYTNIGDKPCLCAINCVDPEESDFSLTICQDEIQEVSTENTSIVGDPANINITFLDSIGNKTNLNVHSMIGVKPTAPFALYKESPKRIETGFYYTTENLTVIKKHKVQYQIWRYKNNIDNAKIWKDWSSSNASSFYDKDIRSGITYGYAVKFRGEFGEESDFSDWIEVVI
jgi:hypothetical protein